MGLAATVLDSVALEHSIITESSVGQCLLELTEWIKGQDVMDLILISNSHFLPSHIQLINFATGTFLKNLE